jgi:hypothetical protein
LVNGGPNEKKYCRSFLSTPDQYTVKKRLAVFPSPAGMSLTKLSLAKNNLIKFGNLIIPGQGEFGK